MPSPLQSLLTAGTKLWLDSIDPELVRSNRAAGATAQPPIPLSWPTSWPPAASTPKSAASSPGARRLPHRLASDRHAGPHAQQVFLPVWEQTGGNDGYVSFEVDPLLEDPELNLPHAKRVAEYVRLGHSGRPDTAIG